MTGAARWMRTLAVLTLMLVGALLVPPAAGAVGRPAAQDATTDPLQVELTSVTPGAIPKKGPIVLEGIVRNSTEEPWTGLNVYPLASPGPMTTREQVDAAAVSDPETTSIGERILADGTSIGDLAPGASSTFIVRVRQADLRSRISGAPGVYWIGVQVLGQNADGRDLVADGRARTFIPLVTGHGTAGVSLVVPLRREVRYAADGSLLRDTEIAGALAPDGRLGRLAALGKQAGARPLTWLIDPAVLDAAQAVADGNPPLDLGRASRHPRASKSPSPSTDTTGANGAPPAEITDADQAHAKDWLATVTGLARSGTTLALPYADPDVSAVARLRPSLLAAARSLSSRVFSDRGIDAAPAAAPPDGYLDPDLVDSIGGGKSSTVLLSDHGRPTGDPVETDQARRFVYADARTAEGGPSPGDRVGALELRQRILADAALTALAGGQRPLVVALPQDWDPGTYWQQADFFGGLDQTWLTLQDIPGGTPTTEPSATEPASARRAELPVRNLDVAAKLVHTATIVGDVLDHADGQSDRLRAAALGAVSYHARDDPGLARVRVDAVTTAVDDLLDRVRVVGTDFVTLSGSSGVLTVSVVNGLDKPVRVGLRASTGSPDVRIDDVKTVRLAAGQRTTVRLQAHAGGVGVHRVTLSPVTSEGQRFGAPLLFNLRTSQVGRVFWGVLIVFGALLLVMVARRVRQRIGAHRWRQ